MNRIVVIGGGAAGMMAAIAAAEAGAEVTLLEKNERLGKKLYITGKGRCNVTNACTREDFFAHVLRNPRFLYSCYDAFSNWEMSYFLEQEGLPLKTERGNRVFPASDKSSDVIRTLQRAMERRGVRVLLHTRVRSLWLEALPEAAEEETLPAGKKKKQKARAKQICRGVFLEDGREMAADRVIVATGGISYPSTGSTGDGYLWAMKTGHGVEEPRPALVPFDAVLWEGIPCRRLQGLSLRNVGVQIFDGSRCLTGDFGELLFTHFGVSGPVVLTASSEITALFHAPGAKPHPLDMRIDLKPALTEEQLDRRLLRELEAGANKQMKNLLGALFPAKLIPVMLQLAHICPEACGREVTRQERLRLLQLTKAFPVKLSGTRGFGEAIITQGGVAVQQVDPHSMESKRTRNLFFAGEVLDVDARTGGYNLQIAWSTGHAAGLAAAGSR